MNVDVSNHGTLKNFQIDKKDNIDEFKRVRSEYPDRFPIIINTVPLHHAKFRNKYLISGETTLGHFRNFLNVLGNYFIEGVLHTDFTTTIKDLYDLHGNKSSTGFLHLSINREQKHIDMDLVILNEKLKINDCNK